MSDIYSSGEYLSNNPDWHEEGAPEKAANILKLILRNGTNVRSVAEVGCGSGQILAELQKQLPASSVFHGYDISPDAYSICSKKTNERLHFFLEDLTGKKDAAFDLLLVIDVIEHIENYFEFLRKLKHQAPYFIFHIPLDLCTWTLFREEMLIESKKRVGHIHNFSPKFIRSILDDLGYETVDWFYTPPQFENMTGKQRFVNGFRKLFFAISKNFAVKTFGGYSIMLLAKTKS
ncbi:MAG: hypothetical protein FD123_1093 [Bacteroidetes bacterium]|nr:MAG: hypothetical protein FD123_1093 [Bacteroidota bacterium]